MGIFDPISRLVSSDRWGNEDVYIAFAYHGTVAGLREERNQRH
jgi:hypothetical protein